MDLKRKVVNKYSMNTQLATTTNRDNNDKTLDH